MQDTNVSTAKIVLLILTEISPQKTVASYVTRNPAHYIDTLKNFTFNSSKSLVKFLEKYKSDIINKIPDDEATLLEKLESQEFLDHLNAKWYDTKFIELPDIISAEDILDIAVKYQAVNQKQMLNYLLEKNDGYVYDITFKEIL